MPKKLFVRFSTAQDEKDIFEFYAYHQHQFVFQRDPEVWKERIASGAVTLIQDEDGKIVASAISYPVMKKGANGNEVHEWTEIGSVRVAVEGIGLFKTLVSAQVLRAYLLEPPADRFVAEIVVGNNHSKHAFTKNGATLFDIPEELREQVCKTITSGSNTVEWFQLGVETIPAFAQNFIDSQKNPTVKNKATGEEYELDFSRCILVTTFKDEVKDLALQNFGDIKKPDLGRGLNSFKGKFHP
ncbi:MAG: hypothetical protein HY052_04385 [Proteobacteria bacterium]|nr:hypothetical protein [Pseudomonadota bacterium]